MPTVSVKFLPDGLIKTDVRYAIQGKDDQTLGPIVYASASPIGSDTRAPVIVSLDPPAKAVIAPNDQIRLVVRDEKALKAVLVLAFYDVIGKSEVVFNGEKFGPNFSLSSRTTSVVPGTGETHTFRIQRSPGWLASPRLEVFAVDTSAHLAGETL